MLQESSTAHRVCKGPAAARRAGLHRTGVYNRARSIFWCGSQINHCLQCTRRNQTSPHCGCRQSPCQLGCYSGFGQGGERGSCPCLRVVGPNMFPQAAPEPVRGPGFSCSHGTHHTGLALRETSLTPCSPQAARGCQRDRQPHVTERISEDETRPKR